MKYGLYLPNFGPFGDPLTLVEWAQDAERAGWDGFFIWDHIARYPDRGDVVDPWIALSAIAVSTHKIKIGALVTPLARRRPWKVARETVSLDHLSKGRLIFSVGLGGESGKDVEWGNFGEISDLKVRAQMLDEGLDILSGLWSGDVFRYNGIHYQVKDSQFLPTPAQSPRIPIWGAGYWPHKPPFRRAARWDGAFPLFDAKATHQDEIAQLREVKDYIMEQRGNAAAFDIVCRGHTSAATDAALVASYQAAGATWWLESLTPLYFGSDWEAWPLAAMLERIHNGPPKT